MSTRDNLLSWKGVLLRSFRMHKIGTVHLHTGLDAFAVVDGVPDSVFWKGIRDTLGACMDSDGPNLSTASLAGVQQTWVETPLPLSAGVARLLLEGVRRHLSPGAAEEGSCRVTFLFMKHNLKFASSTTTSLASQSVPVADLLSILGRIRLSDVHRGGAYVDVGANIWPPVGQPERVSVFWRNSFLREKHHALMRESFALSKSANFYPNFAEGLWSDADIRTRVSTARRPVDSDVALVRFYSATSHDFRLFGKTPFQRKYCAPLVLKGLCAALPVPIRNDIRRRLMHLEDERADERARVTRILADMKRRHFPARVELVLRAQSNETLARHVSLIAHCAFELSRSPLAQRCTHAVSSTDLFTLVEAEVQQLQKWCDELIVKCSAAMPPDPVTFRRASLLEDCLRFVFDGNESALTDRQYFRLCRLTELFHRCGFLNLLPDDLVPSGPAPEGAVDGSKDLFAIKVGMALKSWGIGDRAASKSLLAIINQCTTMLACLSAVGRHPALLEKTGLSFATGIVRDIFLPSILQANGLPSLKKHALEIEGWHEDGKTPSVTAKTIAERHFDASSTKTQSDQLDFLAPLHIELFLGLHWALVRASLDTWTWSATRGLVASALEGAFRKDGLAVMPVVDPFSLVPSRRSNVRRLFQKVSVAEGTCSLADVEAADTSWRSNAMAMLQPMRLQSASSSRWSQHSPQRCRSGPEDPGAPPEYWTEERRNRFLDLRAETIGLSAKAKTSFVRFVKALWPSPSQRREPAEGWLRRNISNRDLQRSDMFAVDLEFWSRKYHSVSEWVLRDPNTDLYWMYQRLKCCGKGTQRMTA